jgi:hypothetical protein
LTDVAMKRLVLKRRKGAATYGNGAAFSGEFKTGLYHGAGKYAPHPCILVPIL